MASPELDPPQAAILEEEQNWPTLPVFADA
jgi:hypothetical protein